ncbi:MAG: MgtC/SapB family protein [Firmicutes bacterium]|nr:MgtC/SapB family protein [Bacillota bacterium]
MASLDPTVALLRLFLAALAGGIIGLEREHANRPAGFRTHILVSAGACLVALTALSVASSFRGVANTDPTRMAAHVISGIGFLGAGAIMREGLNIRGLTTAASIWVIATVGLAMGMGLYWHGAIATLLAGLTLHYLPAVERRFTRGQYRLITVVTQDTPGQIGRIGIALGNRGVDIRNIEMDSQPGGLISIQLYVRTPPACDLTRLVSELATIPGVKSADTTPW